MLQSLFGGYRSLVFAIDGSVHFTNAGFERSKKRFNPDALKVSLKGKTAIVTGANAGLGKTTAIELLKLGARVIMVCRNPKSVQVKEELSAFGQVDLEIVDMSIPREIKQFAQRAPKVDILVNNAGVLLNERQETKNGIETTFATNTLGVYYLTELLIPKLNPKARVVTVSSGGMYNVGLSVDDLEAKNKYDGTLQYAQTKRAEVELTKLWSLKHPQFYFYSMHPGWSDTPGVSKSLPTFKQYYNSLLRTPEQGADTIVWASASEEVLNVPNGAFLFDRQETSPHVTFGNTERDPRLVEELVSKLQEYITKNA
ncbi:dehydrogenase/reductase SDR family member 12-like protein [Gorgonomyces haynaldii]|nr:dehydrogenase/reductase SDR family member 12-like protein [Gorgonomyces haynaldii]